MEHASVHRYRFGEHIFIHSHFAERCDTAIGKCEVDRPSGRNFLKTHVAPRFEHIDPHATTGEIDGKQRAGQAGSDNTNSIHSKELFWLAHKVEIHNILCRYHHPIRKCPTLRPNRDGVRLSGLEILKTIVSKWICERSSNRTQAVLSRQKRIRNRLPARASHAAGDADRNLRCDQPSHRKHRVFIWPARATRLSTVNASHDNPTLRIGRYRPCTVISGAKVNTDKTIATEPRVRCSGAQ